MKTAVAAAWLVAEVAVAGGSRTFRLSSFADFNAGESDGVRIGSPGEVRAGYATSRVPVAAESVWCAVKAPGGDLWFGTGDDGRVLRLDGEKTALVVKLDAVLVTSLAVGRGVVYAGTLPGGRIYAITPQGKAKVFATLDAEHIWALSYDHERETLFAATGPNGQLFAIDRAGRARLHFDSKQKQLLTLVPDGHGAIYVGSADKAILYRVDPDGSAFALHDFASSELRALGRDQSGTLYAAVNEFDKGGSQPPPLPPPGAPGQPTLARPAAGKGKATLYRIEPNRLVEPLLAMPGMTFHALDVASDGTVWVATADEGRVLSVYPDGTAYTVLDLDETQVLTIVRDGPRRFVGTGDGAALYAVSADAPDHATYRSKVLDAGFLADWGQLRWRAQGQGAVDVATRCGNTAKPDATWSTWQPVSATRTRQEAQGRIVSRSARYLQVRAGFPHNSDAVLTEIVAYYQARNQPVRVTEITVGEADKPPAQPSPPATPTPPVSPPADVIKLRWKTDNPDGDSLVYRLWFREESEVTWRPISVGAGAALPVPDVLDKPEFDWNTESVADGTYRVKVVASDERANPEAARTAHFMVSDAVLVDNRKPEVLGLAVEGSVVAGRALDTYSPVEKLDFAIDGGLWRPMGSIDGILDAISEPFRLALPKDLAPGVHTIAIRATDAGGNIGVAQVSVRVK